MSLAKSLSQAGKMNELAAGMFEARGVEAALCDRGAPGRTETRCLFMCEGIAARVCVYFIMLC